MDTFQRSRLSRALLRAIALGFAVAAVRWLPAQTYTPPAPGATPRTPVNPAAVGGAGQAGTPGAAAPVGDDTPSVKVNFPGTPIQGIIPVWTQLTGKKLILDASMGGESVKIIGNRLLTKREAISFIQASLLLNGYAFIDVDNETSKLIHASSKDPSSQGIPVVVNIRDLPVDEQVVFYVMPLENISPDEATKAFSTVVKLNPYGAITPVNNTSNIIIKENTTTIRSIYNLAKIIDVPPPETANEIIELKRSDAEGIAEILTSIYEQKDKSDSAPRGVHGQQAQAPGAVPGAPNPGLPSAPGGAAPSNGSTNPTAARVQIFAQRRTNSLLVIARPVDILFVKQLVDKLDRETTASNFLERKLRYMPVTEFLDVAKDALSVGTDIENDGGTSGGAGGKVASRTGKSSKSSGSNRSSTTGVQNTGFQNQGFGNGLGGGMSGGQSQHGSLDNPTEMGAPESAVVGKTLLIADPRSNTLIVNGSPEHIEIVDKLIERMDVRPQQIYISAIIGQLNLGNTYDYGLDMLKTLDDFTLRTQPKKGSTTTTTTTTTGSGVGGLLTSTTSGLVPLQADGTPGLIEAPLNFKGFEWDKFNVYGQIGSLGRYIHMLDGDKNFKVLNRTAMSVRNNEKASVSNGQKIAVPISSLSNVGGIGSTAAVSSSIDYRDVVLRLEVVPLINSDDEVTLKILQVNDNVVGSQNVGGNNVPTIGTQEIETTVSVKDGSTVVLGGLITEREQKSENGILTLRRIPVLGKLFGRTQKSKDREELLIFIQPKIIRSSDPLDMPNRLEEGRSKVLGEGLRFATDTPEVRRAEPAH